MEQRPEDVHRELKIRKSRKKARFSTGVRTFVFMAGGEGNRVIGILGMDCSCLVA